MKGIVVPEQSEDYAADTVELFFDLSFVFAFSQIVHMLVVHPDWGHIGKAGLIFLLLWLPWTQFTWAANAVPGRQRSVRVAFLIATAASIPMGAAVERAFDSAGPLFVIPLAVIYLMALAIMLVGLDTGSAEFRSALTYFRPNLAAMTVLVIGGFLDDGWRVAAWIISILIVIASTQFATSGDWVLRPGHFAERHGLIVIIALGEVVVALGRAVVEPLSDADGFQSEIVIALVATGVAAGVLWWSYFDRVQPALEHRAEELTGRDRSSLFRDAYTYSHALIVAGVILVAVALQQAAVAPSEPMSVAIRAIMLGGITCFTLGIVGGIHRAFHVVPLERLAIIVGAAIVLLVSGSLDAVWVLVILDAFAVVALVVEHQRIEQQPNDPVTHEAHTIK